MTTTLCAANPDDPGDDVQRRFRYQHAYGVILVIDMFMGTRDGVALWCEHHEDYLVEQDDGSLEAIQIKTRKPERGEWTLSDEGLAHAIKRFCALHVKFGDRVKRFAFVTNAEVRDGTGPRDSEKSPLCLFRACSQATQLSGLGKEPMRALKAFARKSGLNAQVVFEVLRRLSVMRGPSLDDFDSVLSHEHLTRLPECASFGAGQLNAMRDELIHVVYRASSLAVAEASRHTTCVLVEDPTNPAVSHKRLVPRLMIPAALASRKLVFRMLPLDLALKPTSRTGLESTFDKKAEAGGLGFATDTLRRRTVSAESAMLEVLARSPEQAQDRFNEWAALVKAECDDARLRASQGPAPYGQVMLDLLTERLRARAGAAKETLAGEHDFLLGVAGLLTEACHVWWSDEFPLGER